MVDIIKQDMTDIWASSGDITAPSPAKIATGWIVEAVPRQWWNWFENRQDTNIAYILQKGIPEWDIVSEYLTNKSYIQRNNIVYKCILTNSGQDPSTSPLYWVKAFPESSASLEALRAVTPAADTFAYFTSPTAAATSSVTAFARSLMDDVDAATARATLQAQLASTVLTTLSTLSPATNKLPYFTGTTSVTTTDLTAFARTLLDDVDVVAARATLGVDSAADASAALAAGLATKQPLDATLTALAGAATATNTLSYWTGTDTTSVTPFTSFARTLLDDADAGTARSTLGVYSTTEVDTNLSNGLATKQPLNALLTSVSGLNPGANTIIYYTATNTGATTTLTTFARSILDDVDAAAVRTTIGANDAANLTTGTLDLARLPANLTGKNAATATALQTPRTIQGVSFDGTANITLSVVDKDSSTGSAALPSGTTAQRTASPSNGFIRYNNETNEFEGYQNGGWAGIGGGNPLFTVLWWPSRTAIPAGYIAADGQTLNRSSYQAATSGIIAGNVPVVTDANWLSNNLNRASYTLGDGSTTIRIPDLNGKSSGTFGAPFLRGDGLSTAGVAGQLQASQNLAHFHTQNNLSLSVSGSAVGSTAGAAQFPMVNGAGNTGSQGGTEARPVNATGVFIIKLIGGATDLSQEDASVAVAALDAKLDSVTLYPGGTSASPPTLNAATRIVIANPFIGSAIIVKVEIRISGFWGEPQWFVQDGTGASYVAYGAKASHYTDGTAPNDSIVIQSGGTGVAVGTSSLSGAPFGVITSQTSAPYRVQVWKVKGVY